MANENPKADLLVSEEMLNTYHTEGIKPISQKVSALQKTGAVNLLPNKATSQVIGDNVSCVVNSDGTITANGSNTTSSWVFLDLGASVTLKSGVTYYLSGCTGGSDSSPWTYFLQYYVIGGENGVQGDAELAITPATDITIGVRFVVWNGVSVNNITVKPMLSLISGADYQPYAETNPVLTQKISALEETGALNLLHNAATSQVVDGVTFTVNSDGTISTSGTATDRIQFPVGTINIPSGKDFRLTGCPAGGESGTNATYCLAGPYAPNGYPGWVDKGSGFKIVDNSYWRDTDITIYIWVYSGTNMNSKVFKPMVSDGRFNFSYADYQPYAMTNRELTDAFGGSEELNITSSILTNSDLTFVNGKAQKFGPFVALALTIKTNYTTLNTDVHLGTFPAGWRPKSTTHFCGLSTSQKIHDYYLYPSGTLDLCLRATHATTDVIYANIVYAIA